MANELTIADVSDYAAAQVAVWPDEFDLSSFKPNFDQDLTHIFEQFSGDGLSQALRQYRHKVMVWIIHQDMHHRDALKTCSVLSDFAEKCIAYAVKYIAGDQLMTVAFGKLGGQELNFSSDVDLMFVGDLSKHRRHILKIVKLLSEKTAFGFVFRVDLRLRPFGESGPLAMGVTQCLNYYEKHGRDWERYAWVKARVITGDAELLKPLERFIYRPYIDFSLLEGLRSIKTQIVREARDSSHNIKLGSGGIRELEFMVQSVQIIYGESESLFVIPPLLALLRRVKSSN